MREINLQELVSASDNKLIARNFSRIRKGLGLTQEKAAELGGVTTGYVGKVEIGAVSFGTRAQQKWSKVLGVDRAEFLRRPDTGLAVVGEIIEKGVVLKYGPEHELEYMPVLSSHNTDAENAFCLKVSTDALYPHLRKDSCLYIVAVPVSTIRNDDLIIYTDASEQASVKEAECLNNVILFKGLGKGSTVTEKADGLANLQKIVLIAL